MNFMKFGGIVVKKKKKKNPPFSCFFVPLIPLLFGLKTFHKKCCIILFSSKVAITIFVFFVFASVLFPWQQ
jgi:hypothetical protein